MAISDIGAYAHLDRADIEAIGAELDAVRSDIQDSLGARDADYIHRLIRIQRSLDVAARAAILLSPWRTGRWLGTAGLAAAKCLENMELGHNISHGQWDWMNDPEIHSSTWEWDMVGASAQWRYAHNYRHHVFTNVLGMDDDIGFSILRVTQEQPWSARHLAQPAQNLLLAATFEWAIALYDLDAAIRRASDPRGRRTACAAFGGKIARQLVKDYAIFPALSGRRWRSTLMCSLSANVFRNLWTYIVIVCGHFADGVGIFAPEAIEGETRADWYLRQMLGSANFDAGPLMAVASGHLCYQIEHHLFPDLPSRRYPQIAARVRALCDKYDLPYTSGPLRRQFLQVQRTIMAMSLRRPPRGAAA
ncbi:acyl-CoA desaturase [Mycolicibacterium sp. 018/SC-01/001]|uniref:fatty acid desaturase family protein n=1 Tax=Mycolicibacterium sp. 018/SC-01/001 TaxID=2592069 RepID=UPI00117C17ED|nr:acyl-CoA desaturase [Mycolicibacterium sp. 018/SC-01/001]TRW78684.1 acyl-CoA desaturase [Mycolicibacterium sp. 018/SC-01/001]